MTGKQMPYHSNKKAALRKLLLITIYWSNIYKKTASGISPTRSELGEALEYLIEIEDAPDEIRKNNLNKQEDFVEREKAEGMRKVGIKSLGATKRRNEEERNSNKEPKRRRSAGRY